MTWFPPPMRFTLPGLLLAGGLLAQGALLQSELDEAAHGVDARISSSGRMLGTILSAEIETAFRTDRDMVARNLVMHAGADPDLEYAALLAPDDRVLFSSDLRGTRGAGASSIAPEVAAAAERVRDLRSPSLDVDRAARGVTAAFPVQLAAKAGEWARPAVLLMRYDTSRLHAMARQRAIENALVQGAVVLGIVLGLYAALRWLFVARVHTLLQGARRIEKGDYGARVVLSGRDEIANLGRSFDAMARQVESRDEALRRQGLELRTLLENLGDAVLVLDADGRIRECNPAAEEIFATRVNDLIGTDLAELVDSSGAVRIRTILDELANAPGARAAASASITKETAGTRQLELAIVRPAEITPTREFIASARDMTYRVRMEQRLRQSHKMEAIGNLAGGVAHDFNNLLSVITIGASALEKREKLSRAGAEILEDITDTSKRAADLTRQLLVFTRRRVASRESVDLDALVGGMARMLGRLVPDNITLSFHSAGEPLWVDIDGTSLEQIVANLVINARDATADGGRIEVVSRPGPGPERAVQLEVTDDGCGMTDEVKEHIFEPFFTTKKDEETSGTGLGLSTVYELVRQHGGTIDVDSAPGRGTTFTVTLPAGVGVRPFREGPAPPSPGTRWTGTVLVVEDQAQVRKLVKRTLEVRGVTVLCARSAEDALETFDREEGSIDAVVTDIGLPGMNGLDLRSELLRRSPGLPVLLCSGYADEPWVRERIESESLPLLEKPFLPDQLLEMMQGLVPVLREPRQAGG